MLTNKYFCLNYTKYLLKIAQNCKKSAQNVANYGKKCYLCGRKYENIAKIEVILCK